MIENVVVFVIVLLAAIFLGKRIYRLTTGKGTGCGCHSEQECSMDCEHSHHSH